MARALRLAARGRGRVSPNPMVGALVVQGETVIAEGWHQGPGTLHAEAMALLAAGETARGATVYTTLEPCDHHGRTPPCNHRADLQVSQAWSSGRRIRTPSSTAAGSRTYAGRA